MIEVVTFIFCAMAAGVGLVGAWDTLRKRESDGAASMLLALVLIAGGVCGCACALALAQAQSEAGGAR